MSELDSETARFAKRLHVPPIRVHLLGVAGSGMSGLASLLMGIGHRVSGSDRVTTLETERLVTEGLVFNSPQSAEEVEGTDLVIYSSAVRAGNPAYDAARAAGIPVIRRAEALAAIMNLKDGIVICGTHGKTTTSSMAAHVLRSAGTRPSHYVGAEIPLLGTNAHWEPDTREFVAEGDESDGTLALFHPRHTILLNVEEEHLDFYDGIDAINRVFSTVLDQTEDFFIYCGDDPGAAHVARDRERAVSYGWNPKFNYAAVDIEERGGNTDFQVLQNGQPLGEMTLSIPGRHNVLNALSVVALATELGNSFGIIKAALGTFRGAKRRFEQKFRSDSYLVYDDYGHHPSEIRATLDTARSLKPERMICAFQPHRFSRTKLLREDFGTCFNAVDELLITDIYPASEDPIPGITGDTIRESVGERGTGVEASFVPRLLEARNRIGNALRSGDLLISLGAGNIHEITTDIARDLEVLEKLTEVLDEPDCKLRLYEPMSKHTTMKIGGPAQFWAEPTTVAGFARLVDWCRESGTPLRVIGRGSNLLVRDGGIPGLVIHPGRGDFKSVTVQGAFVEAGVGASFKQIAAAAQNASLAGFEWMEGIPGGVGGGIRMNAGAMGTETFDQVVSVTFITPEGEVQTRSVEEINHQYRSVPEFTENYVVSAVFSGTFGDSDEIQRTMDDSKHHRKSTQPLAACAGCIFKNPTGTSAGRLVDELGLKDTGIGKARVSEVHANFIVNDGGARAAEVLELIDRIKDTVLRERDIQLETEVQIIGQNAPF